jgi:hypothetical protein
MVFYERLEPVDRAAPGYGQLGGRMVRVYA